MNSKFIFAIVVLVLMLLLLFWYVTDKPPKSDTENFSVRTDIYGEVADGTIYTSTVDLSALDTRLPASTPYLVELSTEGELLMAKKMEVSPFNYRIGEFGTKSYSLLHTENERWSSFAVINNPSRRELYVNDNEHTDFHSLLRTGPSSYLIPSYKLHVLEDGRKAESFFIEERKLSGSTNFTWDSLDHIPIEESDFSELRPYWIENEIVDYFHGNSIEYSLDRNYLISGRNINQVIKISSLTGEVLWRLGGKSSDFVFIDDPLGGFNHQHSASQLKNGNILIYDNGNLHKPKQSRVVEYKLDETNMTATLVWSFSGDRYTYAAGSVQRLDNGNTLIGWGFQVDMKSSEPRIIEIDSDGNVVMKIYYPADTGLYSAYKY